jgi:hypothetical protein
MKILNTTKHSNAAKLILAVLVVTCVFTAAAKAQPSFQGKFTLPYEVHWNHSVLPAGEYSIQVETIGMPAILRSTSRNLLFFTGVPIVSKAEKGAASLTVTIRGNQRRVRSMNLPEIGALIFEPLSQTEREMLAKTGQIDSVPVVTAQK